MEKQVKYNREELCHTCGGSGAKAGTHPETCHKCGGRGQINVVRDTPLGRMQTQVTCDVCNGTGKEIKEKCETCHGSGHEKWHILLRLLYLLVLKLDKNAFARTR